MSKLPVLTLILILIAFLSAPASSISCLSCTNNRNLTCRQDYISEYRSFSRYECTFVCDTIANCTVIPYCNAFLNKVTTQDSYWSSQGCQRTMFEPNATCGTSRSRHFGNSSYIQQLFTRDYVNTSQLPEPLSNFPIVFCGCNTSYCNRNILFSFTHDAIPVENNTISTNTSYTTNSSLNYTSLSSTSLSPTSRSLTPNNTLSPLPYIPSVYLTFIAAGVLLAFVLAILIICSILIWRCCKRSTDFSSYRLAGGDKADASRHEMATLSSPDGFYEDPELARVPILTDLKFEDLIGSGKYGHVWRCMYEGRELACKVWLPCEVNAWRSERAIFSQDTTYHPNIVMYVHSGFIEDRGEHDLVRKGVLLMELCSRGSLSNFLETSTLSWSIASRFAFEIASGISYLHSHFGMHRNARGYTRVTKCPIAHRDIKSSNVLIRANMTCCISDLGLALPLNPNHSEGHFGSTEQVGTPFYMAPEALAGRINLSNLDSFKQMDVFSMGLVLWEVFCRCYVDGSISALSEHKIPFSDVHRSLLQGSRVSRVELIQELKEMHESPIEKLLPIPPGWREHPLFSKARRTILDCTYKDADARVTANVVASRFQGNMAKGNQNEQEVNFCESMDFGSFASLSSLMRMAENQRLSRINCDNYTQLPEYSV